MRTWSETILAASVAAAAVVVAHTASAQTAVEWQGSASASTGVTSNVANTPVPAKRAPVGTPAPEWDGFGDILPAVELTVEDPRTTNAFVYAFDYRFYFLHHEANSVSNTIGYTLETALSDTVEFSLGLTGAQTQLSAFNVSGDPSQSRPLTSPGGNNYLLTGVINQGLTVSTSELDSFGEGIAFTANDNLPSGSSESGVTTTTSSQTYLASSTLDYAHQFEFDSLGFTIGNDAGIFPETAQGGLLTPEHVDLVHSATLDWHHDWAEDWSTTISGGALVAYQGAEPKPSVQPDARGSVDYASDLGAAGLEYSHTVAPNVLLGEMTLGDSALLHGAMPIGRTQVDLSGSAEFLASRPLLATGGYGQVTGNILVDAAAGYDLQSQPMRFELRYQLIRQFAITDPVKGQPAVPEIRRTNVLFTFTYYFPDAPAVGRGPTVTPLPASGSNPSTMGRTPATRGELQDADKQGAKDRREKKKDKEKREGGGGGEGGGEGGGQGGQ